MEILIPITLFVMIAAIVIVPNVLRSRERMHLHDVLRTTPVDGAYDLYSGDTYSGVSSD